MSAPAKLTAFAAALLVLFGGAAVAGNAIDPDREEPAVGHGGDEEAGGHAAEKVRGATVAANGLRIAVENPELKRGRWETLRFRIVEEDGATLRDFDIEHTKRMHVIVVRRDMAGFQHLHPSQAADGAWELPLKLGRAGSYRFYADFSHDEVKSTLATDLRVDGDADLKPMPAPRATAVSDRGYDVKLTGRGVRPGEEAELAFEITSDGERIVPEEYLGAGGHLVALREGDMAFLHVHPTDDRGPAFGATFPTAGRYRLFLQFKHEGRIHTVAFTQEVR